MDQITDFCSESTDCTTTCGEYRHFCPMWTENEGEIIHED